MTITMGDLVINLATRQLTYQNKAIPLTKLEYDLLLYLIQNRDKICTYDDLLENVWKYENGSGHSSLVQLAICRLRRKLGMHGLKKQSIPIRTVREIGFHFDWNENTISSERFQK